MPRETVQGCPTFSPASASCRAGCLCSYLAVWAPVLTCLLLPPPCRPSPLLSHPSPFYACLFQGLPFFYWIRDFFFFKGREIYFPVSTSTVFCKEWFLSVSCLHVGRYFSMPRVWKPPETTKVPGTGLAFVPLACLFPSFF